MDFHNKNVRRVISIIILAVIAAMVLTMVVPYMMI